MKRLITENLYAFYDEVGSTLTTGFRKEATVSWLNTGNGCWPNMIYNTAFSEKEIAASVANFSHSIQTKKAPPFWLVEDGNKNQLLAKELTHSGMRPIMEWKGMGLVNENFLANELPNNTEIIAVQTQSDLAAWLHIVNTALMTSNKVDYSIFEALYTNSNFELYLLTTNNIPVATGLAYFANNTCGIYMIATLEEARKKGFGSAVTKHCVNAAHQKGIANIVLHATQKGVSVYKKIGFKAACVFTIFWMLGKDYK